MTLELPPTNVKTLPSMARRGKKANVTITITFSSWTFVTHSITSIVSARVLRHYVQSGESNLDH